MKRISLATLIIFVLLFALMPTVTESQIPNDSKAKLLAYDQDKCMSNCQTQYEACIKRGAGNNYCGTQQEQCLNACISH